MERLTELYISNVPNEVLKELGIEDVPKKDYEIIGTNHDTCKETCEKHKCLDCPIKRAIDKLAEYEDLEEQGLLRKLPCKPGDRIYVIPSETNFKLNIINGHEEINRVYKQEVNEVRFYPSGDYLLTTCEGQCDALQRFFGITWFLTEQEAQDALEKMKGE